MNLHYKMNPVNSVDDVYDLFPSDQFESPTRSTIPLLSWLKHETETVNALINTLGMPDDCTGHLEYTVKSPKGEGPPSQTDLMLMGSTAALAFECKWTEPIGDTVEKWYKKVDEVNGPIVLEGWLQLLQRAATQELARSCFGQAIIQMIHRAASACDTGERPQLAYLLFHPSPDSYTASSQLVRDELAHLWRLLGQPQVFEFSIIQIDMEYTPLFEELRKLPKKSQETAARVTVALSSSEKLFQFGEPAIQRIGATA